MRRSLLSLLGWFFFLVVGIAHAGEAGRIVFVTGEAKSASQNLLQGQSVFEGAELSTGKDGYVYLKTIDNGFFILRPNSRARVVAYRIDQNNPANTRIKFELLNGVARSISGEAVKKSRQNFRFNTPVAAIGVRGTDFTVFTDQETSRVAVLSGAIVVSGFAGACGPEGSGPCEGAVSHELLASQVGQLLQVKRGQAAPQLLNGNVLPPDVQAPPRPDEPKAGGLGGVGGAGGAGGSGGAGGLANAPVPGSAIAPTDVVNLDAQKNGTLVVRNTTPPPVVVVVPPPPPPVVVPPVVVVPPPVVIPPPPIPPEAQRQIVWGRWQSVLDKAPNVSLAAERARGSELLGLQGPYALLRTKGEDLKLPESGTVSFVLTQSEAQVLNESSQKVNLATIENARLQFDFGKKTFNTSFDLLSDAERFKLKAQGDLTRDGRFFGEGQFRQGNNINLNGVLGPDNGSTAAYVFQGRLDDKRVASGLAVFGK
jgi:FecR protein